MARLTAHDNPVLSAPARRSSTLLPSLNQQRLTWPLTVMELSPGGETQLNPLSHVSGNDSRLLRQLLALPTKPSLVRGEIRQVCLALSTSTSLSPVVLTDSGELTSPFG